MYLSVFTTREARPLPWHPRMHVSRDLERRVRSSDMASDRPVLKTVIRFYESDALLKIRACMRLRGPQEQTQRKNLLQARSGVERRLMRSVSLVSGCQSIGRQHDLKLSTNSQSHRRGSCDIALSAITTFIYINHSTELCQRLT